MKYKTQIPLQYAFCQQELYQHEDSAKRLSWSPPHIFHESVKTACSRSRAANVVVVEVKAYNTKQEEGGRKTNI